MFKLFIEARDELALNGLYNIDELLGKLKGDFNLYEFQITQSYLYQVAHV